MSFSEALDVKIQGLKVRAFQYPTATPESDGTFEWASTTIIVVEAEAADMVGIGYSYADVAAGTLIKQHFIPLLRGKNFLDIPAMWQNMAHQVRNIGFTGVASAAIAAVDIALWDLKAKLLKLPLCNLLGKVKAEIPVYGSGGFTSYTLNELKAHMLTWKENGFDMVKIKIGRNPEKDMERVVLCRETLGDQAALFVDANGAYNVKQALDKAYGFAEYGVTWFEEPVSSDNLEGLRFLRAHFPTAMEIAAGEYGYRTHYFTRMIATGAVDVLQVDATRCGGITGFLRAGWLAAAFHVPISSHTAPSIHLHPACTFPNFRHLEYFYDHMRLEHHFFEGAVRPKAGILKPNEKEYGLGIALKYADVKQYEVMTA